MIGPESNQGQLVAKLMEMMSQPIEEHSKLLSQIADAIRDETSEEDKVEPPTLKIYQPGLADSSKF